MNTKSNREAQEKQRAKQSRRPKATKYIPNRDVVSPPNPPTFPEQRSLEHNIRETQYYWELVVCKNLDDFKNRILLLLNTWGFSDFSYGILGEHKERQGVVKYEINNKRVITSMRPQQESFQIFSDEDLVVQHARINTLPVFQSAIGDYIANAPFVNRDIKHNLERIRTNREAGYHDSYNIPVKADSGGNSLFSVTARDMPRIDFQSLVTIHQPNLHSLALAVDYVGRIKFPEHLMVEPDNKKINVNPRPMALLTALATENLSLKEAAKDLNISIHTANKHVAAIKKALGAKTQASAVFTAIKEGLITFKY